MFSRPQFILAAMITAVVLLGGCSASTPEVALPGSATSTQPTNPADHPLRNGDSWSDSYRRGWCCPYEASGQKSDCDGKRASASGDTCLNIHRAG
jgi:hypothetical protein